MGNFLLFHLQDSLASIVHELYYSIFGKTMFFLLMMVLVRYFYFISNRKNSNMKKINTTSANFFTCLLSILFTINGFAQNNGLPQGWDFVTTSSNPHGIIVMLDANPRINDMPIEAGDYIGVFFTDNSGNLICGGADFWPGDENIIFTANGDDPETPEKDGFSYAEQMYFKVYSWNNQKEYNVDEISWSSEYYSTDHWYPLGLSAMTNLVCNIEFDAYASATPNPVCLGDEISLTANIFVGTNGNYSYIWNSQPAGFSSTEPASILTPDQTTTYFLEVSDGILTSSHELTVVVNEIPFVEACEDMTICPTGCATLSSTAMNYSSVEWESQGDGSFENQGSLDPLYYPGETDIANGSANLTVVAYPLSACDAYATDEIGITIQSIPTINTNSFLSVCGPQNISLDANATNYSSIQWSSAGDGTFSDANAEITQYYPGATDLQNGEFLLSICATAVLPVVGEVCSEVQVEIVDEPAAFAPASISKCDNLPIPVTCIPSNYSGLLWSTEGDGTFENPETASTMYFAGEQDKLAGGTVVTVNIFGEGACEIFPVSKTISISLYPSPVVDAGDANVVCAGQNLELNGLVENFAYFMWTSSGDGYFSNQIIQNPVYYPGSNDVSTGNFTLTLTAYPIYPCTASIADDLFIEIVGEPSVDINMEDNQVFPLDQALEIISSGSGYQSLQWETSGDGTFDDPHILSPSYFPGTTDGCGQNVTLSVTAFAATNCGTDATDQVTVSFTQMASVSAGDDMTICQGEVGLSACSQYCNSLLWQTTGDGTFDDTASATATYFPGTGDIGNGLAELCVSGFYGENQTVSDYLTISIIANPTIDPGFTQIETCYNQSAQIEITALNYSSIFWYTTNGGGMFSPNGSPSTTYNPAPLVDYPQGCITIFVLAQPLSPCSTVDEASFELCFVPEPSVYAGEDATISEDDTFVAAPDVSDQSFVFWMTAGDGYFDDETTINAEYFPGPDDISNGGTELTITAFPLAGCTSSVSDQIGITILKNQTIHIAEGWSGFSSYIAMNPNIETVFAPVADFLITAQTMTGVYWPDGGINNIGVFSNSTGYKVKMNEAATITLTGNICSVNSIELTAGWNLIPVLSTSIINQYDFADLMDGNLLIMKEIGGNGIIWPELNIYNIPVIKPGSAYLVAVNQNTTLTYDSPGDTKSGNDDRNIVSSNFSPWTSPEKTTVSHVVAFTGASLEQIQPGDFIGAFNENGTCVGLTEVMREDENIALTVFGDEAMTEVSEGMAIGETIGFRLYNGSTQTEIPVAVQYSNEVKYAGGLFAENGVSIVEDIICSTFVEEMNAGEVSVYPNPSKGLVTIHVEDASLDYHFTISNMGGQVILDDHFRGSVRMNFSDYPKGVYLVVIKSAGKQYYKKLILE
jgi:hypothetical protein